MKEMKDDPQAGKCFSQMVLENLFLVSITALILAAFGLFIYKISGDNIEGWVLYGKCGVIYVYGLPILFGILNYVYDFYVSCKRKKNKTPIGANKKMVRELIKIIGAGVILQLVNEGVKTRIPDKYLYVGFGKVVFIFVLFVMLYILTIGILESKVLGNRFNSTELIKEGCYDRYEKERAKKGSYYTWPQFQIDMERKLMSIHKLYGFFLAVYGIIISLFLIALIVSPFDVVIGVVFLSLFIIFFGLIKFYNVQLKQVAIVMSLESPSD